MGGDPYSHQHDQIFVPKAFTELPKHKRIQFDCLHAYIPIHLTDRGKTMAKRKRPQRTLTGEIREDTKSSGSSACNADLPSASSSSSSSSSGSRETRAQQVARQVNDMVERRNGLGHNLEQALASEQRVASRRDGGPPRPEASRRDALGVPNARRNIANPDLARPGNSIARARAAQAASTGSSVTVVGGGGARGSSGGNAEGGSSDARATAALSALVRSRGRASSADGRASREASGEREGPTASLS